MFESVYAARKHKFLKPGETPAWEEDKTDLDTNERTGFIYNANISLSFELQRQRLPIFHSRNELIYLLENHQTVVLVGDTGCGKSTQIPQYLVEAGWCQDGKIIGVTEPRRVAAITLATRVAEETSTYIGQHVGYSIRFNDCFNPSSCKIKYMTEGILMREMMGDPLLRAYSVIVVDEVHERTLSTDIIMGLLKKILRKRRDLHIIVTSATVDAEKLNNFFNYSKRDGKQKDTSVIMSVEGRLYPVEVLFSKNPVPDYVLGVVTLVLEIHKKEGPGDILVFLTGQDEVNKAVAALNEAVSDKKSSTFSSKEDLLVLPMYGSLSNNDQLKVFRRTPNGCRKVVVATNIAETSVTIPGIVYVVDSGFVKIRFFNSATGFDSLVVVPVSKAAAEQRAGRAGRVRPGKVYRMYTEADFEKLAENSPPEMQRSDLCGAVLQLKALGIDNVLRFSFPSPPPARNLLLALELLHALGTISDNGTLTQPLGIQMAEFPLSPLHAKALLASGDEGCSEEVATIIAVLQVKTLFVEPHSGSERIKARVEHHKFEAEEGDLLTWLNVFAAFKKVPDKQAKTWCTSHYINHRAIHRVSEIKGQLLRLLEKFDIAVVSCEGNGDKVRRAITSGFFPNAAFLHHSGGYRSVRGSLPVKIDPSSVLYNRDPHEWLLFCDMVQMDQTYIKDCMAVQPDWLLKTAPHFYHIDYKKD